MGIMPVCESEAVSLRDRADELACPIHMMVQEAIDVSVKNGFYSSSKSKSIKFEVVLKVNEDSNRIELELKNSDNSIQW